MKKYLLVLTILLYSGAAQSCQPYSSYWVDHYTSDGFWSGRSLYGCTWSMGSMSWENTFILMEGEDLSGSIYT